MAERTQALVIGAGFAGLGTARELLRRGVEAVVLEANERVAEPWRGRYESLRLNTIRWQSHAPGRRMPRSYGVYPRRDDVVAYLDQYVRAERIPVEYGVEATRIDREPKRWIVRTSEGDREASAVIVATGFDREPKLPDWPGRESFEGELIHSSRYRNPEPYAGKDVLVVAAGTTGSEVAHELATSGAGRVWSAVRGSPTIVPRMVAGRIPGPIFGTGASSLPLAVGDRIGYLFQRVSFGDLTPYGLPPSTHGFLTNMYERSVGPAIDGGFVAALKSGRIRIVAAVEAFDGPEVVLADGERLCPDAVIAATGYRRGLEPLVGHLGVVQADGQPTHNGPSGPPQAPGLWFVGYEVLVRGQLPLTRIHAKRVARAAARWLGRNR